MTSLPQASQFCVRMRYLFMTPCFEGAGLRSHHQPTPSESESCSVVSDSLRTHGLYSLWNSLGQNTGVGSLSLLPRIFPTQGSNQCLPHRRWILYQMGHQGSPRLLERVAYLFSRGSSQPRNRTGVSCIAGTLRTELSGKFIQTITINTLWNIH